MLNYPAVLDLATQKLHPLGVSESFLVGWNETADVFVPRPTRQSDIAERPWYPEPCPRTARKETRQAMTLTISLPPETEQKLLQAAAQSGLAPDALAQRLIEQGLNGGPPAGQTSPGRPGGETLARILAPFRKEVEQSGMTDDDLREFFTEARDEVRAEKRAKRPQGPVAG